MIAGESLSRLARDTFGTLLHEAARGLAWARKIQDTSRQGRYHNKEYKALAEQVGRSIGAPIVEREAWTSRVTTGEGGATGGAGGEGGEGEGGKRASTMRACACGRQIRVSAAEYTRGYIMCGLCGKPFLTPGESDEPADRVVWSARVQPPALRSDEK